MGVGQKRPFLAENLTEKIPIIYREPDREYDRELKLNTPKRGLKYPENGGKDFWRVSEESMKVVKDKWMRQRYLSAGGGEVGKVKSIGE